MLHKPASTTLMNTNVKRHYQAFMRKANKLKSLMPNGKASLSFEDLRDEVDVSEQTLYKLCDYLNKNADIKFVLPQPSPRVRPATVTPHGHVHLPNTLIASLGLSRTYVPGINLTCEPYGRGVLILPEEESAGHGPATAESVEYLDDEAKCDFSSVSQDTEVGGKEPSSTEVPVSNVARTETGEESKVIQTPSLAPKAPPIATGAGVAMSMTNTELANAIAEALSMVLYTTAD